MSTYQSCSWGLQLFNRLLGPVILSRSLSLSHLEPRKCPVRAAMGKKDVRHPAPYAKSRLGSPTIDVFISLEPMDLETKTIEHLRAQNMPCSNNNNKKKQEQEQQQLEQEQEQDQNKPGFRGQSSSSVVSYDPPPMRQRSGRWLCRHFPSGSQPVDVGSMRLHMFVEIPLYISQAETCPKRM